MNKEYIVCVDGMEVVDMPVTEAEANDIAHYYQCQGYIDAIVEKVDTNKID